MNVTDFFDPYNIEHIKAFNHLKEEGAWPEKFFDKVKENIREDPHWYLTISMKMANAWVKHSLEKDGK